MLKISGSWSVEIHLVLFKMHCLEAETVHEACVHLILSFLFQFLFYTFYLEIFCFNLLFPFSLAKFFCL